jgi:hypothetical protein
MPPVGAKHHKHEYSVIEPYPSTGQLSQNSRHSSNLVPLLQDPISVPLRRPEFTAAGSYDRPPPKVLVSALLDSNSSEVVRSRDISQALQSIPQPRERPLRSTHRKPKQSKSRPGKTSKSVLNSPRPFGKPRKEVHRTYTRQFKHQVLSYWHHYQIPIGPTAFRTPTEKEVGMLFLVPRSTIRA